MPGCLVKRCLSFLILGVNKLPVGQQQLDHTKLAAPGQSARSSFQNSFSSIIVPPSCSMEQALDRLALLLGLALQPGLHPALLTALAPPRHCGKVCHC